MTDRDLWLAIEARDLQELTAMLHPQYRCDDCRDTGRVERNIDGCDVEVECVLCTPQKLWREQR